MKAIPMRGRLVGKRVRGYLWAGPGKKWRQKENYFQLEDDQIVSACFYSASGSFWLRCRGGTCEVTLKSPQERVLSTAMLALPRGRKQ